MCYISVIAKKERPYWQRREKMKKALVKDSVKEIKNTYKRFMSILLMAFLGVGFFAGIKATSPDMVDTIDSFYKNQQVYDIQVLSTLGLSKDDIDAISKIDNIEKVDGTYETDGAIDIENKEVIAKVMTIGDFNKPILINGSLPQDKSECVVEENFLKLNNKKIGDNIEVEIENSKNDDGEEIPYFHHQDAAGYAEGKGTETSNNNSKSLQVEEGVHRHSGSHAESKENRCGIHKTVAGHIEKP